MFQRRRAVKGLVPFFYCVYLFFFTKDLTFVLFWWWLCTKLEFQTEAMKCSRPGAVGIRRIKRSKLKQEVFVALCWSQPPKTQQVLKFEQKYKTSNVTNVLVLGAFPAAQIEVEFWNIVPFVVPAAPAAEQMFCFWTRRSVQHLDSLTSQPRCTKYWSSCGLKPWRTSWAAAGVASQRRRLKGRGRTQGLLRLMLLWRKLLLRVMEHFRSSFFRPQPILIKIPIRCECLTRFFPFMDQMHDGSLELKYQRLLFSSFSHVFKSCTHPTNHERWTLGVNRVQSFIRVPNLTSVVITEQRVQFKNVHTAQKQLWIGDMLNLHIKTRTRTEGLCFEEDVCKLVSVPLSHTVMGLMIYLCKTIWVWCHRVYAEVSSFNIPL